LHQLFRCREVFHRRVAPVARWRSHAQYSAPSRETLDGVNSLARALTAAFCGANQRHRCL
ncbi:hypothetical protein ACXG2U_004585, partial [Escherichia coli]